ncbi:MAG: hypothetical protein JRN62_06040 [Nitrososphaerota archaeon]|nr:hypothetical protein [Nitrososphaerota archaeon]
MATLHRGSSLISLEKELSSRLLKATKDTFTNKRRTQNVDWVRALPLDGLRYEEAELQIPLVQTSKGEKIVIQYPGKESLREKNPNRWDFRPKLVGKEESDLTFEQIWDPLFDDLKLIKNQDDKLRIASILATLYYRIAFLADYRPTTERTYKVDRVSSARGKIGTEELTLGPYWEYVPPAKAVNMVSRIIPTWAGMSFEAFLHYNSLLAWNEDMKIRARFDKPPEDEKKPEKWNARDPRGRINTLLTYIHVIGFIIEEVRPSALLGGFARQRGMSTASEAEVVRICRPYITKAPSAMNSEPLDGWQVPSATEG